MLKNVGMLLIGILIGAIGGGGYFYKKLGEARGVLAVAKSEAASASRAQRERDEQLQKIKSDLAAAENSLKQAVTARESAEASLKQALAARDTAKAKQAHPNGAARASKKR